MHAGDVMTRQVQTVAPETTIAEAVGIMRRSGHGALPVVDGEGKVLGMITDVGIMSQCLPEYLKEVGDLYGTGDFPPFEERVRSLGGAFVRDLMQREVPTAEENTPLAEVAALMTINSLRHIPVVSGARLSGIVGVQDIIDGIARGARKGEPGS